jgi:5'-nucleotidase
MGDVVRAMPWANTVDVVTIPGRTIKQVLEHSVSQFKVVDDDPGGRFLQVSGMTVTYDVDKPVGQRLVDVQAGTAAEGNLAPIDDEASYEIAVLSFMGKGGDGYSMIPENTISYRNSGLLDNDLIVAYLGKHSYVSEPELGRIRLRPGDAVDTAGAKSRNSGETATVLFNALVWIVLKIL